MPRFGLALAFSGVLHVGLLLLWLHLVHTTRIVLVTDMMAAASPGAHQPIVFQSQASDGAALLPAHHRARRPHKVVSVSPNMGTPDSAMATLRKEAQRTTASLMKELQFRLNYGIGSKDYDLPVHKEGEIPLISAADLPPRFEQYLEIEILIDTTGSVAEAKIVHGDADQKIENRLLAAVRQFKYIPAKYLQRPVPCQMDIVVHIPS